MDPAWWKSDRSLSLDAVKRIVKRQFPDLGGRLTSHLSSGWDSEVFEVEGGWLFRFPKRVDVLPSLEREKLLLPALAAALPLAIPRFERMGWPDVDFPYPFVGYRKLPGVPLQSRLHT